MIPWSELFRLCFVRRGHTELDLPQKVVEMLSLCIQVFQKRQRELLTPEESYLTTDASNIKSIPDPLSTGQMAEIRFRLLEVSGFREAGLDQGGNLTQQIWLFSTGPKAGIFQDPELQDS